MASLVGSILLTRGPAALGIEFSLQRVETVSPDCWRTCALAKVLSTLSLLDKEAALGQTNRENSREAFGLTSASQSLAWSSAGALGWQTVFLGDYFCFQPQVLLSRLLNGGLRVN